MWLYKGHLRDPRVTGAPQISACVLALLSSTVGKVLRLGKPDKGHMGSVISYNCMSAYDSL